MKIRILLADDHRLMCAGLHSLLDKEGDLEVVGEAFDGRTAVQLAEELTPHVVVLDVAMPDLNGIEATRQILKHAPDSRVLALSMHSDRRYVSEMLLAGASGYLLKDCALEELAQAIRIVHSGQRYLSPKIASTVVDEYVRRVSADRSTAMSVLSDREREVLQLLAEGRSTKEIAAQLHVSPKTVETHRRQVMHKLDLHSVAQLTKFAVKEGLTSL
jgi:DNA-binding NarL/FixJ family response regulator